MTPHQSDRREQVATAAAVPVCMGGAGRWEKSLFQSEFAHSNQVLPWGRPVAAGTWGEHRGRRTDRVPATHVNDSRHWRDRAAEMRSLADWMKEVDAAAMMLRLADDYDLLADRADQRANGAMPRAGQ
jgi:hypothetical protein